MLKNTAFRRVQCIFEQALNKHHCSKKAQTPRDNPSPVTVSEPKHVKNEEMLKRKEREKQLLAKTKKKRLKTHLSKYF